jgi:hypothetical protein
MFLHPVVSKSDEIIALPQSVLFFVTNIKVLLKLVAFISTEH